MRTLKSIEEVQERMTSEGITDLMIYRNGVHMFDLKTSECQDKLNPLCDYTIDLMHRNEHACQLEMSFKEISITPDRQKENFSAIIKASGFSVNKLAIISGIAQKTYNDLANGTTSYLNASHATIIKMASGLNMTIDELDNSILN